MRPDPQSDMMKSLAHTWLTRRAFIVKHLYAEWISGKNNPALSLYAQDPKFMSAAPLDFKGKVDVMIKAVKFNFWLETKNEHYFRVAVHGPWSTPIALAVETMSELQDIAAEKTDDTEGYHLFGSLVKYEQSKEMLLDYFKEKRQLVVDNLDTVGVHVKNLSLYGVCPSFKYYRQLHQTNSDFPRYSIWAAPVRSDGPRIICECGNL